MKIRVWCVGAVIALASAIPVSAQDHAELADLRMQFENSARKFVALAEAMPAAAYDWAPDEGVMPVARVYMHVARYNYMYPLENLERESPIAASEYRQWEGGVTEKAEVVRILTESMDYVRDVFDGMDATTATNKVMLYGREVREPAVMLQLVAHMNEHLGQSIAYARMNGVVPPWSS